MNAKTILDCPMCGWKFDPDEHRACNACPVNHGCQLVCCPSCGYQTVDPQQSGLARFVSRWLPTRQNEKTMPINIEDSGSVDR